MSLAIPSLGLGMLSGRSLQARAIAALTAAAGAEPWFLYDHRGIPFQYQDPAGTTPALVTQPIGLVLDMSQGGARGAEMATAAYATPVSGSPDNVTTTVSATAFTQTAGTTVSRSYLNLTTVVGRTYEVVCTLASITSGTMAALARSIANGAGSTVATSASASSGELRVVFVATGTAHSILWLTSGTAVSSSVTGITIREIFGLHVNAASTTRPNLVASPAAGALFDASDDALLGPIGGAGTTGLFYCAAVRPTAIGTSMMLWNDIGSNTGYYTNIQASGAARIAAGNGVSFTTATTANTISAAAMSVLTFWDDGTNLNVQIGLGTVAQIARPAVSAGSATFTTGKANTGLTALFGGVIPCQIYGRNMRPDAATRLLAQQLMAQLSGASL